MGVRDGRKAEWDLAARVRLLEQDNDALEMDQAELKAEITRLKAILVGLLTSTTVAAIVLAATRAAGG